AAAADLPRPRLPRDARPVPRRALPVPPVLQPVRDRRGQQVRPGRRELAGRQADLPVPPVGRPRVRPGV
ncbi:MAG: Membrane protein insertion efficiency factor YidD, partial [uncultured Phycisphaerae bacterium]